MKKTHPFNKSWQNGKIKVINCLKCKFIHQYPLPSRRKLSKFYKSDYYEKIKPEYIYQSEKKDLSYRLFLAENIYTTLLSLKGGGRSGRVLDIGCSTGVFLSVFKRHNWQAWGVEPYLEAAKYAERKGIKVICDEIENIDVDKFRNFFDFIYMRQVIDHLLDPADVLKMVSIMLRKGGIVCIDTANDFNPLQFAYVSENKCNMWWITPDHISNFSNETIKNILTSCGFKVCYQEATFPVELFLLMGMDYRKKESVGPKTHMMRKRLELTLERQGLGHLLKKIYASLADMGLGRTIITFAKK